MTREDVLNDVKRIEEQIKKPIPVRKYKRTKLVQEEIVEAYKMPLPGSIIVKGKPKQVEKDKWVVVHEDGTQECYTETEFKSIFEDISFNKFGDKK